MKRKYKRKFKVPGNTLKRCSDFEECHGLEEDTLPCRKKVPTAVKTYTGGYYYWVRDESRCPYPINQPNYYIVSETIDGEWQCSCPAWKFRRKQCHHIKKAQENPDKYEILVEFTGKRIETLSKILK